MVLQFICTFSKLEGIWYQKQFFLLFSHPLHWCMGLFGIESIRFIKNTLLATCFVVSVLKEKTKMVLKVIRIFIKLEGVWYKTVLLTFFAALTFFACN